MNKAIVKTEKRNLVKDTEGANLVEYLILVGLVALAVIIAFTAFGDTVEQKIEEQGGTVGAINGAGS